MKHSKGKSDAHRTIKNKKGKVKVLEMTLQ